MVFMVQTRADLMSAATSERSKTTIRGFSLKRLMRPSSAHRKSVLGWTPICLAIDFALENFRRLEASVRSEATVFVFWVFMIAGSNPNRPMHTHGISFQNYTYRSPKKVRFGRNYRTAPKSVAPAGAASSPV